MTDPMKTALYSLGLTCLALIPAATLRAQPLIPYEQKENVIFGETHGTGLLMDVFTPKGKSNGLAIVDVASGAWHSDRGKIRDHALAQLYRILCARGYTVFAVRPGSKTRYTIQDMDRHLKMAIRYVKERAADYAIDSDRLGLTGASAGGHLAALAALTPEEGKDNPKHPEQRYNTSVKAVGLFFPPTDFLDWDGQRAPLNLLGELLFLGDPQRHTPQEIEERARDASPVHQIKGVPMPFLLIHGDADKAVPLQQSKKLAEALKAAGGSAELIVKKGGGHPWLTIFEEVKLMADWFDRQLGGTSPD